MSSIALVIIDLQEDFLPADGSLAVPNGREIIPKIIKLLNTEKYKWKTIIATQDWHPKDHCSFASQHGVPPFTELEFKHPLGEVDPITSQIESKKQIVWPDHCVQHSFGSTIESEFLEKFESLKDKLPTKIVQKGYLKDREYYSCFMDTWKIHKTEMQDFLIELGVTDVVFVGLAYDFCVVNSAIDCSSAGFNTFVIKDCCKSVYSDKISETDKRYEEAGIKIISFDDSIILNLFE